MNIGIVLAKPPSYSETFFNSKIKGLKAQGYTVVLFVQDNNTQFEGCKVILAPKVSKNRVVQIFKSLMVFSILMFRFKRLLKFMSLENKSGRPLLQILKNSYNNSHLLKADLDWLHFGFTTLALQSEHVAKSIAAKMGVSCRGYDMDVYPLKHPNCYQLVWKHVDKVHAISKYMLQKAYSHGLQKSVQSAIIYPAIQTLYFDNISDYNLKKTEPLQITTIARLHNIKGLDYTLQALKTLKNEGVSFRYQIIGDGPEYERLQYITNELELEPMVDFRGQCAHEETLDALDYTDLYIQYSLSEGFCNAVLEAQAKGCLCVVSDGGALPENVIDGETGFVVASRNPKELATTILKILKMPEKDIRAMTTKARHRALVDFTIEKQMQSFIEFYE